MNFIRQMAPELTVFFLLIMMSAAFVLAFVLSQ
jgi:hypothetical protein